jgi:chorismate-pyruvate lyase
MVLLNTVATTFSDDLIDRHFIAQTDRPNEYYQVDLGRLPPLQRAMLLSYGSSLTVFLETYFLEPVSVTGTRNELSTLGGKWSATMQAPPEAEVILRRALIRTVTRDISVHAESILVLDHLPSDIVSLIESNSHGIGSALRERELPIRTELLWCGLMNENAADHSGTLARTYRIVVAGKPGILITESFSTPLEPV